MTLVDSKSYAVIQSFFQLANWVREQIIAAWCCSHLILQVARLAFSPDGDLLAAGCWGGHMYIFALSNGSWAQVSYIKCHSDKV